MKSYCLYCNNKDVFIQVRDLGAIYKENLTRINVLTKVDIITLLSELKRCPENLKRFYWLLVIQKFHPSCVKNYFPKPIDSLAWLMVHCLKMILWDAR